MRERRVQARSSTHARFDTGLLLFEGGRRAKIYGKQWEGGGGGRNETASKAETYTCADAGVRKVFIYSRRDGERDLNVTREL